MDLTASTAQNAIVKLQAFCRGCMTRQKVSNMIGAIIEELERAVQNETEEFGPLAGETGNTTDAHGAATLDMSERSVGTASTSSSLDEQQLIDYLHHLIQEEQGQEGDKDDNSNDNNVLENSMEFDLDHDQDPLASQPHSPPLAGDPNSDYTGAIDSKIERYLQSPKKSVNRSVTRDIKVKRGSVQAATSIFSAPLHNSTFTTTPKKPKTPWKPNVSERSPRLSSSSIMDKVNIFSQSLPMITMSDEDLAAATAATSPRKKRGPKVNPDTAQSARKALAGRHRLLRQAAITIQARARGYLVRKFDLKAMNKVMEYVKEYQILASNQEDDPDELPIPLDPESETSGDAQDQMDLEEEPIPEPKVEELEKAWSVLQINRASQTRSQDPTAPSDEQLPQPIKVKELLSTWEWLKAKQRDSHLRQQQQPPPLSTPPTPPTPSSSQPVHHPSTPMQEATTSQSPSLDVNRPMGHDSVQASSLEASANESMPLGSSDTTLPLLPDPEAKDRRKGHDLPPPSSTEHPFLARISDTAPPRTGDLVAFYSWLEQNRLYQTASNSFRYSAAPSRRDAAAEIKQAKLSAITTMNNSDDTDHAVNRPSPSTPTEPSLPHNSTDELESSTSIKETTNAVPTLDANIDVDNQAISPSLESAASVQQQQQEPYSSVEHQQEIHQSSETELAPTMSTPQLASPSSQAAHDSVNLPEEDPPAGLSIKAEANKSPRASPTSTVYTEQHQMEATIAAISKQLESLASSTSSSLDNKRETHEQMLLRKIRENIRTGKVNFDEVFELWTWLEMNDFDMTKFKKRAVELGIVDSSTMTGLNIQSLKPLTQKTATTTTINKLDQQLLPSQTGSVQSRIQANIQQIEQKVQQHGFVRPQSATALPGPIRSYSTPSHEEDKDQSNQYPKERGKLAAPMFLNETNRDSGPTDNAKLNDSTTTKPYAVEYINEDLSAIYRPQTNKARKLAQNWWSNVYVQADAKPSHQDHKTSMDQEAPRGNNSDRARPGEGSRTSPITYLDEDLSNVYRNQRGTPQSLDRCLGANIDEGHTSGSQIMYLDEDLSNVYKNQSGPRRHTSTSNSTDVDSDVGASIDKGKTSGSQIMYLDEDLSDVYKIQSGPRGDSLGALSKNLDRDVGAKINEGQTPGSQIMYLDEDLSNVYRNQTGPRRDTPAAASKNLDRDMGAKSHERQTPGSQIMYLDEDLSNVYRSPTRPRRESSTTGSKDLDRDVGAKSNERQTPGSPIMYLDEDLSNVYRSSSTTNQKGSDRDVGVQRGGAASSAINPMLSGNQFLHRSLQGLGEKINPEELGGSQIIYLDEDISNVYRQGITASSRGNKTSDDKPYSHRPEVQTDDASQSTIEYIDEDLSRVYASKTHQGVLAKPSLQAMVTYWEFSKLNNPGDNEMQRENDKPPKLPVDHQRQKDTHPSWQTNPYSNKMLNTLKWLEKQGVDLDKLKATDDTGSDSLAESTQDLALSASQLESNAITAATLKEQDLTKTMDWLVKHGHLRRKSITPTGSPTGGSKTTLSSNTDTSALLVESKEDVFEGSSPVGETTRRQTKSDLTVALRWLKRHSYQASDRRASVESNDPSRLESQLSLPGAPRTGNQDPASIGAGSDETEKKSREPLYDKKVLYSLSWLQKHGFDLDKSIHAERKRDYIPLEKQNIDSSQGTEGEAAPTIESMMEALAAIDDDENQKGMTPQQKRNSLGRPKTPSKASPQDVEKALTWLAARGIGKPNKKPSTDAAPNEAKGSGKKPSSEIQSDVFSAATERSRKTESDKKGDKVNLSSNEMSSALKWLNRKGIATTTTKPLKSSAPRSPEKSPKSKRKPKGLTNTDTKKILDIMKTQGTFSQNQRLSQEDVEQTLRFLKLQESKNAVSPQKVDSSTKKVKNEFHAKQLESMSTKTIDKDLVSASKKEARTKEPSKKVPPSPVRKNPRSGASRIENTTLPKQSDPSSSRLNIDSSSKTKSESTGKARDKPQVEKKSNSRSSKTRSESPGPRKNTSKTRNAKEMRSKSGDFFGDISSPKKSKSSASTADMQKSLKWLQTKASMASPLRTPTATAQSQLSTKDWKNRIPSLAPLDADDQPSSRSRLPPLPGKKKTETAKMDEQAVQDYHNALKFLNRDDIKGLEDASYFKKLDNTLPKRLGESKEARAKEIAKALAWVKKQGLFEATSKPLKKSESSGKTTPRRSSSVNDAISIVEKGSPTNRQAVEQNPPTNRPEEEERNNQKESKVQTERKKLSSIKDMTKQAMLRQKEMDERMMEAGSRRLSASEPSELAGQDFENALKFVLTKQAGGDVTGITDAMNFKKLDNMLPQKDGQSSKDRAREMVKLLDWLRKKGMA